MGEWQRGNVGDVADIMLFRLCILEHLRGRIKSLWMDAVRDGADWPSVELRMRSRLPLLPASAFFPDASAEAFCPPEVTPREYPIIPAVLCR